MYKSIIIILFLMLSLAVFSKNSMAAKGQAHAAVNVKSAKFQYIKAKEAMTGGYYYSAVQHFQKAILIKPHFALAWDNMGVALHKLGFPSLAIVSLQKGLKYNPNVKWARIMLKKYMTSSRR